MRIEHKKVLKAYTTNLKQIFQNAETPISPTEALSLNFLKNYQNQLDTFSTVDDFTSHQLLYPDGFESWLGLTNDQIKPTSLYHLIAPTHQALYLAKLLAIYESIPQFKGFFKPEGGIVYSLFFPLKMQDGRYYQVRQMSMPFRLDANGQMVQQLNVYRVVELYKGQVSSTNFRSVQTEDFVMEAIQLVYQEKLQAKITHRKSSFYRRFYLPFTERQYDVLSYWAKFPEASIKRIANALNIAEVTVEGHSKDILKLAKSTFPSFGFNQSREVAQYILNMDVIKI